MIDKFIIDNTKKYPENPFKELVKYRETSKLSKLSDTNKKLVDANGNEEKVNVVYAKEVVYDKTPYTKVYFGDLSFLELLTKGGLRLFIYILGEKVEYNSDRIILSNDEVMEKLNVSDKSNASKMINDLLKNNVIAKHEVLNVYWINISMFYRGERRYLFLKDLI